MNLYKTSKFQSLIQKRVARQARFNPNTPKHEDYSNLRDFDVLQVYEWQARQKLNKEKKLQWKGGDDEDRLEYIKEKRKELGPTISRMLALSSKRMMTHAQVRSDMPFLEFNDHPRVYKNVKGLV